MEEIQTIMGSETEFAVVPRRGEWSKDTSPQRISQFISLLNYILNFGRQRNNDYKAEKMFHKANWWGEDIRETDEKEIARMLGLTGQYAENGARIYVDGTHPEYSTPECLSPFELIAYEKAGGIMMRNIIEEVEKRLNVEVDLLKNNWDYHDASYSCHENYLLSRRLFFKLVPNERPWKLFHYPNSAEQVIWVAHLLTRQIFTGSGRLNDKEKWPKSFSISQRAPFILNFESLDTTYRRAVINTRDRPYSERKKFARLHVICGDSNMADWSNLLKYGTSRLVLLMLEDTLRKKFSITDIEKYVFVDAPEKTFSSIQSPDKNLKILKGRASVLDIQLMLIMEVTKWLKWKKINGETISWADEVVRYWAYAIDAMSNDESKLDDKLDYKIKKKIFEDKISKGKDIKKIKSLDYSYHIVNKDKSFFQELSEKGKVETIVNEDALKNAFVHPPKSRALLRSLLTMHLSKEENIYCRPSWHELFVSEKNKHESIEMPDPRTPYIYKATDKMAILIEKLLAENERKK